MQSRLHLAPVFTRKLAPMPLQFANPVWVKDDQIDLDHHVRRVTLPQPGTRAQFEDCAAQLHAELLDRSRPLWQLVVIDGLPNGHAAYYFKVHHAVVDGQSGVMLAQTLVRPDAQAAARRARARPRVPNIPAWPSWPRPGSSTTSASTSSWCDTCPAW